MTHREALDVISRITYKPEAKHLWLNLARPMSDPKKEPPYYTLIVRVLRPDVYNPEVIAPINTVFNIDPFYLARMNQADFLRLIEHQVTKLEIHEVREWLKLDGKCLTDPHPERREQAKFASTKIGEP